MRALVADPAAPRGLRLGEAPDPVAGASQVLVAVSAAALNNGDVKGAARQRAGTALGWDAAGTVLEAASDGSGPPKGARVVTYAGNGAWAERRAVDTADAAVVPSEVELGAASTLPVAGVTALRALRRFGFIAGERILVTGAAGGVGRYAVQLAALAGAHVVASVGRPERGAGLTELGAAEVVVGLDDVREQVHGVIETVGGAQLVQAFGLLAEGGAVQSIGGIAQEPAVFPPYATVGEYRRLESFTMGGHLSRDLGYLLGLVGAGRLRPQIGWRGSWEQIDEAVDAFTNRRVDGKAVLDIG